VLGHGLDCYGMLSIGLNLMDGTVIEDRPKYDKKADKLLEMIECLGSSFTQKETKDFEPGDVILLRVEHPYQMFHHLVYYTEDKTIIHSWFMGLASRVTEVPFSTWHNQIHSVWRFNRLE